VAIYQQRGPRIRQSGTVTRSSTRAFANFRRASAAQLLARARAELLRGAGAQSCKVITRPRLHTKVQARRQRRRGRPFLKFGHKTGTRREVAHSDVIKASSTQERHRIQNATRTLEARLDPPSDVFPILNDNFGARRRLHTIRSSNSQEIQQQARAQSCR